MTISTCNKTARACPLLFLCKSIVAYFIQLPTLYVTQSRDILFLEAKPKETTTMTNNTLARFIRNKYSEPPFNWDWHVICGFLTLSSRSVGCWFHRGLKELSNKIYIEIIYPTKKSLCNISTLLNIQVICSRVPWKELFCVHLEQIGVNCANKLSESNEISGGKIRSITFLSNSIFSRGMRFANTSAVLNCCAHFSISSHCI